MAWLSAGVVSGRPWEDGIGLLFVLLLVTVGIGMMAGAAAYRMVSSLGQGSDARTRDLEAEVARRTRELNTSEERFRGFAEAASDWFWETDNQHRFTYLSEAFDTASNTFASGRIIGKTRWEIGNAQPATGNWGEHKAVMDAREPIVGFEYEIVGEDGETRFVRINGRPVFDDKDGFVGYRGVGRNVTDLRRAEKERERSERLFLDAISSVPVSIALFDQDDRLVVWNRLYADQISKGLDLSVGISFEEIVRQSMAKGRIDDIDYDQEEWVRLRMERHRNPTGPFELKIEDRNWEVMEHRTDENYTILIAHDVTQMKLAEDSLRQQNELLETVFESIPAALFIKDRNGIFTRCNERFVRFRDLVGKQDVIGKTTFDFVWDRREAELATERDRLLMETGQAQMNVEETNKAGDGSCINVLCSKVPLFGEDGRPTGILGISTDITEQKRAEAELRRQKNLLETVFESIPAALFIKDRNGVFTHCNDRFVQYRDVASKNEIIGKTTYDFARVIEEAVESCKRDQRVMETGEPIMNVEEFVKRSDGSEIDILTSKVPLNGEDGEVSGVLGVFTDITERKQAETALAASEARFRALIDHSPNAISLKDRNGRYLLVNKALADRHGVSGCDFVGKTAHEFYSPKDSKKIEDRDREVLTSGEAGVTQHELTYPNGQKRIVQIARFPIPGVDGKRAALGCISRDVTDQVHAEDALRDERNLLQTVLETIPHAVYWKDRDLVYAGCNSVYAATWGLDRRDVIGKTFHDLSANQTEAEEITNLDRKVLGGESLVDFEDQRTESDGSIKFHLSSKVPLRGTDGRPSGVLGTFSDITERKKAEMALADSEERFRSVTEASADAIIAIDDSGSVVSWNAGAKEIFGRDAESMIGQPLTHVMPERLHSGHVSDFAQVTENGVLGLAGKPVELIGLRADGQEFPLELTLGSWRSGGRTFFSGIFRDITERKQTEETLRRSQKAQSLGNLAAGMAHEINNLLLPISTLTRMAIKRLPEDNSEQTKLKKVLEAAERAAAIIAGVMDFARQDAGKRSRVDPREVVGKTLEIIRSMLPANVTFERRLARGVGRVNVNSEGIGVVLSNLASNAVDALAGKPGNLRISLQRKEIDAGFATSVPGLAEGSYALVRVSDTGCGMDPETIERALDPFFTTKEVGEGTGLGLSVANGIVERHGGAMEIESTHGEGTDVSIFLPLAGEESKTQEGSQQDEPSENDVISELERKYATGSRNR